METQQTTVQYEGQKYEVSLIKGIVWYCKEGEKNKRSQGQSDDNKVWSIEAAQNMALQMITLEERNNKR